MWCWFFKRMVSHAADTDRDPGWLTTRHLCRCHACSRFHEACLSLAQGLRGEALHITDGVRPAGRRSGVMGMPRGIPSATGPAMIRIAIAAVVALVASLGIYLVARSLYLETAPPTKQAEEIISTASDNTWEPLAMNPLATEIENLVSDAESGVAFVLACLDVSPIVDTPARQTE